AYQIRYMLRDSLFQLGRPALGVNVPRAILVKAVEVLLIRFRFPVRNSEVRVPSRKPKEDACHSISSKQAHKNHRDRIEEHSGASVAVSQNCSDKRLGRTSRLAYRFYFRCAPPSRATHHFLYHYLSCNYTTRGGIFIIGEQYVRTLYARRGGGNCRD